MNKKHIIKLAIIFFAVLTTFSAFFAIPDINSYNLELIDLIQSARKGFLIATAIRKENIDSTQSEQNDNNNTPDLINENATDQDIVDNSDYKSIDPSEFEMPVNPTIYGR